MITNEQVFEAAKDAWLTAVHTLPPDILSAIEDASKEGPQLARDTYGFFLKQYAEIQASPDNIVCNDNGSIVVFITIGDRAKIGPDVDWWKAISDATVHLTAERELLKPVTADPITGENHMTNTGVGLPFITYNVAHGFDGVEITIVGKGGGAELYSNYKMMMPVDGLQGVKKFVLDCVIKGATGGRMCPPNIIGVGIGGSALASMQQAWEAATIRPVGSRHPVGWLSDLENELYSALNMLEFGPMGTSGGKTVLDVHCEVAWGNVATMPVSFISQCVVAHRATVQLFADGRTISKPYPEYWYQERRRSIEAPMTREAVQS